MQHAVVTRNVQTKGEWKWAQLSKGEGKGKGESKSKGKGKGEVLTKYVILRAKDKVWSLKMRSEL